MNSIEHPPSHRSDDAADDSDAAQQSPHENGPPTVASMAEAASPAANGEEKSDVGDIAAIDYQQKYQKYKSENKKLRRDMLSLKSKTEEMASLMSLSQAEIDKLTNSKKRLEVKLKESREREKQLLAAIEQGMECDEDPSPLQLRLRKLESELRQVTDAKSAEIEELRKQLDRASVPSSASENDEAAKQKFDNLCKDHEQQLDKLRQQWNLERTSLRQEVRRLNLENSRYRNGDAVESSSKKSIEDEDEEEEELKRYEVSRKQTSGRLDFRLGISAMEEIKCNSIDVVNGTEKSETIDSQSPSESAAPDMPQDIFSSENPDITALQSIITTLRTALQSTTAENEILSNRLAEEQSRSAAELKAFAKTLEGVDDLRKSAERMSREIRRIKIKGYKPTRSDLIGNSHDNNSRGGLSASLQGISPSYGKRSELSAAEEASREMEEAIRSIERQNDAMNQRWSSNTNSNHQREEIQRFTNVDFDPPRRSSVGSISSNTSSRGLMRISEDLDDTADGGFLSFWHKGEEESEDNVEKKKEKKAKERRRKKKERSSNGSVFTSFF